MESKFDWPKAAILQLIEMWQNYEFLYNSKHKLYHNKHSRNEALNEMAECLKDFCPTMGANEVKNKLVYLRAQYTREIARKRAEVHYVPAAYWFSELAFLEDFLKERKGGSIKVVNAADDPLETSQLFNGDISISHAQPRRRRPRQDSDSSSPAQAPAHVPFKRRSQGDIDSSPPAQYIKRQSRADSESPLLAPLRSVDYEEGELEAATQALQNIASSAVQYDEADAGHFKHPRYAENRFDVYGKNVGMKLQDLPNQQRILAEKIINEALFLAELGSLTMSHSVTCSHTTSPAHYQQTHAPSPQPKSEHNVMPFQPATF